MKVSPGRRLSSCLLAAVAILAAVGEAQTRGGQPAAGRGQPSAGRAVTVTDDHHDTSPALRSIVALLPEAGTPARIHPVRPLPIRRRPTNAPTRRDGSLQPAPTSAMGIVAPIKGFDGIGVGLKYAIPGAPSDINGAVGLTQYVQWANEAFAVWDKTAALKSTSAIVPTVYGPANGNTLWKGFKGACDDDNDGDPIVQYDKRANRWVMTQFAVADGPPYYECIAVSTTPDATGTYARYAFKFDQFNDYPKFGVWPDGYYASFNMFNASNVFIGSKACAFDRSAMLAGGPATMQCFDVKGEGGLLPADLDGITAPPAASPEFFLNFAVDRLNLWKFHVDWKDHAKSTFTGPTAMKVPTFEPACGGGTCISQPGSTQKLDSLADRLMYRFAYRNFGTHQAAVVNHAVDADGHSGVRWYELRDLDGAATVYQRGTYAPDDTHRWMASIAQDKMGNMLMSFSASSGAVYPSIRVTGRNAGDPLNTLATEFNVVDGKSAQPMSRWGDYASVSVDPTDDCTFWFTAQYNVDPAKFKWRTYIGATKFTACGK